ncbi:hypothetical protein N658DRAFT_484912 [Parathielavia hyrcaniae]|uniref:Uncharacterized protein n=1 Tax=Parathielavia hyrcaniae TaxID=113614 RepID=A0AAN6Q9U9_9PEZI|nr:hypothetical protein N658DRAFT_484912 [Parathielavia hyrcaniae]
MRLPVSGPTFRHRNDAWLQMRSLERRTARLTRRQEEEEEDSADEADNSSDESADSADSSDDEFDAESATTVLPPLAPTSAQLGSGIGVILLPKPSATATATASVATGVTLGASAPGVVNESPPPPPTTTSTIIQSSEVPSITSASATTPTTNLDDLITSLAGTATPSPTVPVVGGAQSGESVADPSRQANEQASDGAGLGTETQGNSSTATAAGIVLGVLAFVGLLIGAAMLWRKRRRDRGLPFVPQSRFRLKDDDESQSPSVPGPLPGQAGGQTQAKTNAQILDDLLKAAYATDNGGNNIQGAYAPAVQQSAFQQQQQQMEVPVFMDEKAYAALQRPQTPDPPRKPTISWVQGVRPPMPNAPPQMPPSARMYGPGVPQPLKPVYPRRDTMPTERRVTSIRWND